MIWEKEARGILPRNTVMAGNRLLEYTSKPENEPDIPGIRIIVPLNDRLTAVLDYQKYRLLDSLFCYDNDVVHECQEITKKIWLEMSYHTFTKKVPRLVVTALEDLKSTCNVCWINWRTAMFLLE